MLPTVMLITSKTLTLRNRGTLTLPAELRRKYRLEEGEPLTLIDLGGGLKVPLVPKLVGEIGSSGCGRRPGWVWKSC